MSPTICDQCQQPINGEPLEDERGEPRCRECPPIRADGDGKAYLKGALQPIRRRVVENDERLAALRADHDLLDDVVIELLERVEYLEERVASLEGESGRRSNARVLDPDDGTLSTDDALDVLTGDCVPDEGNLTNRIDELAGGPK